MKISKLLTLLIALILCCTVGMVLSPFAHGAPEADRKEPEVSGKININTATVDQLQLLPRIGTKTAQSIVEYRTQHGPFNKADDLTKVRGIGEKTVKELKKHITVEGSITLKNQH